MAQRTTELIADFHEQGFALGWRMAVRTCFCDALDIKWTPCKANGKTVYGWTQGQAYSFKEGDMIYDAFDAYSMIWNQAMQLISIIVQVNSATPAVTGKNKAAGWVRFEVFTPNENRTRVKRQDIFDCSQNEFVNILKTGRGKLLNGEDINL